MFMTVFHTEFLQQKHQSHLVQLLTLGDLAGSLAAEMETTAQVHLSSDVSYTLYFQN